MNKKIFIIRHADAITKATLTVNSDDKRFLTQKGRVTAHNFFKELKNELSSAQIVLSSPLIRTVQTAEIFSSEININFDIELRNELRHSSSPENVLSMLGDYPQYSVIALVSHEPLVSYMVNSFTGKNLVNGFSKCGIARLTFTNFNTADLIWYKEPDLN